VAALIDALIDADLIDIDHGRVAAGARTVPSPQRATGARPSGAGRQDRHRLAGTFIRRAAR